MQNVLLRNKLILPAVGIVKAWKPGWGVFENAPNMPKALVKDGDSVIRIWDYISSAHAREHVQSFCHSVGKS